MLRYRQTTVALGAGYRTGGELRSASSDLRRIYDILEFRKFEKIGGYRFHKDPPLTNSNY